VELLSHQGYVNADEAFQLEMLAMAGLELPQYQEPDGRGPAGPSQRSARGKKPCAKHLPRWLTMHPCFAALPVCRILQRQADPNEYERTRL
jgi:hypothetical protein